MKKIVCYYPYVGTKLNDEVFENKSSWEYHLKQLLAKDDIEIHTYDKVDVKDADYVLVFDNIFYQNIDIMWKLYNNEKLENSVYINYEPITGHAKNHDAIGMENLSNIFSKIVTFDDDIIDNKKFVKGNIANFFGKEMKYKNNFKDRKFLTMITNNTKDDSIIELLNYCNCTMYFNRSNIKADEHSVYKEREKAASYFLKKCPKEFDLYGDLWPHKYKKVLKGLVSREDKIKKLSEYKFAISYDSYTNQNGYISEKIFDCFMAKTIPVYLGADNVDKYIPKECFINKKDFKTYDELYNYLKNMSEDIYNQYISYIEKYIHSKKFEDHFSSESSARAIKNALLSTRKMNYQKAYNSLMFFENKRRKMNKKIYAGYTLLNKDEEHKTITVRFRVKRGSNIRVESNGLKNPKDLRLDYNNEFDMKFDYSVPKFYIRIYNINADDYFIFRSSRPNQDHEYGLLPKSRTKLIYYNYTEQTKVKKGLYVLLHNRRKISNKILRRKNEI